MSDLIMPAVPCVLPSHAVFLTSVLLLLLQGDGEPEPDDGLLLDDEGDDEGEEDEDEVEDEEEELDGPGQCHSSPHQNPWQPVSCTSSGIMTDDKQTNRHSLQVEQ